MYQTNGTNDPQPLGVIIATVISSTSLTVWLRATVGGVNNVLQEGNFYVNTIP